MWSVRSRTLAEILDLRKMKGYKKDEYFKKNDIAAAEAFEFRLIVFLSLVSSRALQEPASSITRSLRETSLFHCGEI